MGIRSALILVFTFLLIQLPGLSIADGEESFESLINYIPASANAIVLIDANGLRNSPLGKAKNWAARNEAAFTNSAFYLPPEADRLVLAAQLNPNHQFKQAWEISVMSLSETMSARSIARAEGGRLDEIAGLACVHSPNDAYFVLVQDDLLGVISPAHRQATARWIATQKTAPQISSYLQKSIAFASSTGSQIVMSLDLKDSIDPNHMNEKLAQSSLVKEPQSRDAWGKVILSLQGVTLRVSVGESLTGNMTIDFADDPSVLGQQAKAAVLQVLEEFGVHFTSIENWSFSSSGNQVRLTGELAIEDLRKMMSLLELPSTNFSQLADAEPASENDQAKVAKVSQDYYHSIETLLNDIEREFRTNRDARRNFAATYMQRYAKRIDSLPILNVDTELVDFGIAVAETLRETSVTQGEANIDAGVRKSGVYHSNGFSYYSDYRSTSSLKSQIQREEQSVASKARFGNWKEIQDASAAIRIKMTQKYQSEF